MATYTERCNNPKSLMLKIIDIITASEVPKHYDDTLTLFHKFCKQSTKKQSKALHELINNKVFVNSIIKHFKQFNTEILNSKNVSKKPSNYIYNSFIEIVNDYYSQHKSWQITETEQRIEHCLTILININESIHFETGAQIRSIFNRPNSENNLFEILSSIFNHCKLYRLHLSNKIFRFLQQMLPPINTSKSQTFCNHFDIPTLLIRCCDFMAYRINIDGDGCMCESKNDYNKLYGIHMPLTRNICCIISIVNYFISSKAHKNLVFEHQMLTPCIAVLCVRLCHELQNAFNLEPWKCIFQRDGLQNTTQDGLQKILNEMAMSFKKQECIGHNLVICAAMEYLYYYSLEKDIKLVKMPHSDGTFESFEESWHDYQYVIALLRWVTNNKILGLYLDTIANKLGYYVDVRKDVKDKKKKELDSYQVYKAHKTVCFYIECKKSLDVENKSKLKKCKGCQSASYCNKRCQKMDWKYHKQICKNDYKDNDVRYCDNTDCKKYENLRRCTGCHGVSYCSIKCQTEHWAMHKKECKEKRRQKKLDDNN